jgi:hypothetical protein
MTRTLSLLLALIVSASPAAGQESPLAQIPAKAPLVIGIKGIKRTTDRLAALLKNAVPDQAKAIQALIEDLVKKGLPGNRQFQGLKDDAPLFLVLRSLPKLDKLKEPSLGLIARVADYKAFRDGLLTPEERKSLAEDKTNGWEKATLGTGQIFFIARKDYAVVCLSQSAAAEFAKPEQPGFEAALPKPVAQKLLESDIAVYVDVAAITKEYDPLIKAGKIALGDLLDQSGEESSKLDKGQAEMVRGLYAGLLQLADDCTFLLVCCDFRPQGLAFHLTAGVGAASKTNDALKTMKPSALAGLQSMPAGLMTYMGVDFGPEARKAFKPLVKNMLAASGERGDQAGDKALEDALDDLLDARPRQLYSAAKMGAGRCGLQVWQYADPAKAVAAQLRMFRALKEGAAVQLIPLKAKPVVKAEAQAYRDTKLHRASLKWDLDKLGDTLLGSDESGAMLRKFSGDGTIIWFGNVDRQTFQVSAKDWKTANEQLDKYFKKEDAVGVDKAFAEARANLPRETSLVTLLHVPQYGQYFAEFLHEALKAHGVKGVKLPAAPEKKPAESYLGIAVTLQAGQASLDFWVPAAAAREATRIVEPVLKHLSEK